MKQILLLALMVLPFTMQAQTSKSPGKSSIKKTTITETTPLQQKFVPVNLFFVMLTKGEKRHEITDTSILNKLQSDHIRNIERLAKMGKIIVAGPFMDDTNWRGIFIMKCDDQKEAEELLKTDPTIASGRLGYEIHPWMTGQNCLFK